MPARSDFQFFYPLRVRYAEVDAQGIVFNAHYLTYFDCAMTEYMRALPYSYQGQIEAGEDFHVVRALVEFKAPVRFDEEMEVGARAAEIGRSSVRFEMGIFGKGDDQLRATGEITWVNAHQGSGKSAPLPEDFVAKIRALEGDHVIRKS